MTVNIGSKVVLSTQVAGMKTTAGVRARIFDADDQEVDGSPFILSHVSQGLYTNNQWSPVSTGNYYARFEIYVDNTFAVIDPDRDWVVEDINVQKRQGLSGEVDKGL